MHTIYRNYLLKLWKLKIVSCKVKAGKKFRVLYWCLVCLKVSRGSYIYKCLHWSGDVQVFKRVSRSN